MSVVDLLVTESHRRIGRDRYEFAPHMIHGPLTFPRGVHGAEVFEFRTTTRDPMTEEYVPVEGFATAGIMICRGVDAYGSAGAGQSYMLATFDIRAEQPWRVNDRLASYAMTCWVPVHVDYADAVARRLSTITTMPFGIRAVHPTLPLAYVATAPANAAPWEL